MAQNNIPLKQGLRQPPENESKTWDPDSLPSPAAQIAGPK